MTLVSALSFAAFSTLVVQDAARTARIIAEHEAAFRALTCGFLVVAVLDVVVAWALYELLGPVNKSLALLSSWLRVMYAAVFAAVLSNLLVAARLLTDATVRGRSTRGRRTPKPWRRSTRSRTAGTQPW
jgi:hypothetical protein